MWKSLKVYFKDLGYWGFIVIIPIVLNIIGIYQSITRNDILNIPSWVWFQITLLLILVIPFLAFHKMRVRLATAITTRIQELKRLVFQARNATSKVVTYYHAMGGSAKEVTDAYSSYDETSKALMVEAEIEGGKVEEVIAEFINYASFHVMRFLAWNGKVISDSDTKQKLEIDELQFVGRMAGRADKTIQAITKALM